MKREKLLLFTLAAINFTHIVDFMIMMPLGPQLMRLFDISPQQFSALVSTYTFSAGVSSFIGAFVLDRFDRKKTLMIAYLGFVIGTFACALAPNYQLLLSARIVTGAFGGVISALILSIIGDVIPEFRRATAIGIVMGAFSAASVVGVPFGLFMANQYSWHAPFIFLGILSSVILGLIVASMPKLQGHMVRDTAHPSPRAILSKLAHNGNQLSALCFTVMLVLGHFSIIPFLSPYMVANVGFRESDLTYIYLIGGAVTIFTSPMIGRLADRIGKPRVFMMFALLTLIPVFALTNLPKTALPLALMVTTIFFVTSGGRWVPATTMITSTVTPQSRGSFMSINSSVQQITAGIAASIAGVIVTKDASGELVNYQYVGYLAIVVSLLGIIVSRRLRAIS